MEHKIDLPSELMKYTYEMKVYIPDTEPPENGFPVHYVLDGNAYYSIARDIIRLQSRNTPKTGIEAAVIVGIGHAEGDAHRRRFYDFTAPAPAYEYPDRLKGKHENLGPHGGAETFLAFLEEEAKPYIQRHYAVDPARQTLFGHSLAGYFTLWTKLARPGAFQVYLASSPSVWWNNRELIRELETGADHALDMSNVLITVGEQEHSMITDLRVLTDVWKKRRREAIRIYIASEENHASVVPTIMSRAFRFSARYTQQSPART